MKQKENHKIKKFNKSVLSRQSVELLDKAALGYVSQWMQVLRA